MLDEIFPGPPSLPLPTPEFGTKQSKLTLGQSLQETMVFYDPLKSWVGVEQCPLQMGNELISCGLNLPVMACCNPYMARQQYLGSLPPGQSCSRESLL